jgi:hypothetical protein
MQDADRIDAQQDAVLWILEAIRAYDTQQPGTTRACHVACPGAISARAALRSPERDSACDHAAPESVGIAPKNFG